jgi:hypothetical protein
MMGRQSCSGHSRSQPNIVSEVYRKLLNGVSIGMARQILGNAHSEDVELWAARIRETMADCGEMRLLELQRRSGLPLVDVWLGLILGGISCLVRRRSWGVVDGEGFYAIGGVWVG